MSTDTVIGAARHTGPANAVTDEESGERWYVYEKYGRLLSVTTAFRSIAKMGLMVWAAQLAARHAFIELPTVLTASRTRPCGRSNNRCRHDNWQTSCERCPCGVCRACVEKWLADRHKAESSRRADEGIRVHDVIEWWSLHGEYRLHDPDIAPYVAAFRALVVEYGLTPDSFILAEGTVINMADRYAGTTDGIIRFDTTTSAAAKLVARVLRARGDYAHLKTADALVRNVIKDQRTVDLIVDWKTREKTLEESPAKFYPEQAMQLAGYRWAPIIRLKGTEVEVPMPNTDGGVIIQLRPDGATPRLAVVDESTYAAFLHAIGLYLWLVEQAPRAIGAYTFPLARRDEPATAAGGEPPPAEVEGNGNGLACDCVPGDPCDELRDHFGEGGYTATDMPWHEVGSDGLQLVFPPTPAASASTAAKPANGSTPLRTIPQRVVGDSLTDADIPF